MITGAAPINDDIKQFFKVAIGVPMCEAYG
jgi:long-subunit acyl-CoA synthetase (AMP-forming)